MTPTVIEGFIPPEILPTDYNFGGGMLGDQPINPTGDWTPWLPHVVEQAQHGFDTKSCVSQAITHAIETLIRQEFAQTDDLSVRFLASATGTKDKGGNDPVTVADFIRKNGCAFEPDYPFDVPTEAEFYKPIPINVYNRAKILLAQFVIGREWVGNDPASIMAALTYSPVTVAVYAWHHLPEENNGYYTKPTGVPANHYTMIVGYKENDYWLVFDSYRPFVKKLDWDYPFTFPMRFTLHRQLATTPAAQSAWQRFCALIAKIWPL